MARVMPILSSVTPSSGRTPPEYERKGRSFGAAEIPEDMHGHVTFSLLLDLPGKTTAHDVAAAMSGTRLAGGIIFSNQHGKNFRVREINGDGAGLRYAPRGRALVPGLRPELRHKVCFADPGQVTMIRDLLSVRASEADPTPGFRVPVAIGFRLLTQPGQNPIPEFSRDDHTPHVFAEPGVGVAELISVRNPALTDLDAEDLQNFMWSWSVSGRHLVAHSVYNP
jgi:hypothetical protein